MAWAAFLIGLLGSFHCAGMCGPLALARPGHSILANLIYNLGRVMTYSIMGIVVGLFGEGFAFAGWQQGLSIGLGVIMFFVILFTRYRHFDLPVTGKILRFWSFIKSQLSLLVKARSLYASLGIGLLNGFLPCGLVYVALFSAASLGSLLNSILFMMFFGLGTLPMMFGISSFGRLLSPARRARINRFVPFFIGLVAILLILRGLNLGIPFVSPQLESSSDMRM